MTQELVTRPRRTQAERTATANRRMLRAARRLIARQGYTKTTLAQVGKEAGYTGGLVSHHFGSKGGLLRELVGRITQRFYHDQILPATEGHAGLIEEGVERGEIRSDLDPDAEAGLFVGMLRGVGLQWMADPDCFDLDAVGASLKDALRRHLAA
jgi:hypothetical protein